MLPYDVNPKNSIAKHVKKKKSYFGVLIQSWPEN